MGTTTESVDQADLDDLSTPHAPKLPSRSDLDDDLGHGIGDSREVQRILLCVVIWPRIGYSHFIARSFAFD